jgi:choline dehydrogenase-like flavoprotein
VWLKAAEANGIHMVPAAVGMASTQFKGRDACIYDGWCHVGCPIGALANPVVTYLGEARKGGAEVRALCTVTRVLTNQDGTRATGVEYYDAQKQKQTQEASVVILAAWSGQNPRILLNSATDKHPNGLANKNQLVGKFMMTHSVAGTWALFDEDITPYMGTIGAQFMSYDRYAKTSYPNAFGSAFTVAGAAMKTNDFAQARGDLFGKDLAAFMKRAAKGITRITFFGEGLPQLENRIELVGDKDEFGMPLAKLTHGFSDDGIALWNANFDQGMKVAKATNAKEAWPGKGPVVPTSHLHGGAIMGTDASNSVTNSYGQTHEIANLWMAGPCIFPTEGASNPTYTIFAVSLRGAEQLAKTWGSVAG